MKIFVGCSSSNDIPNKYKEDSEILLKEILKDNDLVFGAYNLGIMGMSHNIALSNKRSITGICPIVYKEDLKNINCTKEIMVESVSERTEKLISESDILLFLPGGIGTICELFMAIESKRNKEHNKEIIIYNSNNYYDELFIFLEKMYKEEFTSYKVKDNYTVFNDREDVISYIKEH